MELAGCSPNEQLSMINTHKVLMNRHMAGLMYTHPGHYQISMRQAGFYSIDEIRKLFFYRHNGKTIHKLPEAENPLCNSC